LAAKTAVPGAKQATRRAGAAARTSAASQARGRSGGAATRLYRQLLADILHGRQRPGARVRLVPLAASYGTSSTTVREALIRLASDRLVVRHATQGFLIAPATQDELLDLIKTIGWLEEIGIRESVVNGDRHWDDKILAAHRSLAQDPAPVHVRNDRDVSHWEDLVLDFHEALIAACRSAILGEQCRLLHQRLLRYRNLAKDIAFATDSERDYALRIRNALLARDAKTATDLLHSYYRLTADAVFASGVLR
jgi:GntR family transcriptional regulator, carbon starvation induced regulator